MEAKPKILIAIDHLNSAYDHLQKAIGIFNGVVLDLEKEAAFISTYRESLVKTVEAAGGSVKAAIEQQIKDFLPKRLRENAPPMPGTDKQPGAA